MNEDDFLEIKIDGPDEVAIPVELFLRAVNGMNTVVSEVDRTLSGVNEKTHRWSITELKIGSASLTQTAEIIRSTPNPITVPLPQIVRSGLAAIQARSKERPIGFTDKALRTIRAIIIDVKEPFSVYIANREGALTANSDTVAQIDQWLNPQYESYGSVEGRLENVSSHHRLEFTIYDRDNNKIECRFPAHLKDRVKDALFNDVYISGRVQYRGDGVPVAVYPTDITRIVENEEVFNIGDVVGVLDLGMPSENYIRSIRDE